MIVPYPFFLTQWTKSSLERLSGKCSASVMVAYALHYGEQDLPHGSVRRRMALHRPASARPHRTRTPQTPRLKSDPRRCLLRPEERLPLAFAAERLPTLEDRLRLVQEVAYRRHLGERLNAELCASGCGVASGQGPAPQRRDCGFSVSQDHWRGRHTERAWLRPR